MKLSLALKKFDETNLRLAKQLGIDDIVLYDMRHLPLNLEGLAAKKQLAEQFDVKISIVEGGPPIDQIVLGKDGRDQQIEQYKRVLGYMGKLGMKVLCYNFMPQLTPDAMVVRTSFSTQERGGALTSSFEQNRFHDEMIPHQEKPTTDEQMWDYLEYFLKRIVPAAEAAEVKLAMHPDDPPLSPMCNLSRIMRNVQNFDRLLSLSASPVNGITLCQGCFAELGCDIPETIKHFGKRIHFAHFRDIRGTLEDFRESFPDNGQTNMIKAFQVYQEIGYDGFIRSDHAPLLATEASQNDGYTMQGHIFTVGYMKGLMEPIFGKSI